MLLALALAMLLPAGAATAPLPPLPDPAAIGAPDERAQAAELSGLIARTPKPAETLPALDGLLRVLDRPTPLRGLVQFLRAGVLHDLDIRRPEALLAVEESIRLLPRYTGPLLLAHEMHAYTERPGIAADYLLRAGQIDPSAFDHLDDYDMNNVFTRLDDAGDERRARLLSDRLLAVGWSRGRPHTMSAIALDAIDVRLEQNDIPGAKALVPRIVDIGVFARIFRLNVYAPLRETAEAWAGKRFEKLWPIYLRESRAAWEASREWEAGLDYATALGRARHDRTLVRTFAPFFEQELDAERDASLVLLVPRLASSYARLGQWDDGLRLYDRALAVWPTDSSAYALNLTFNRGILLITRGDFSGGLDWLDRGLRSAAKQGGEVNQSALVGANAYRACALSRLGREPEAGVSAAIARAGRSSSLNSYVHYQLCTGEVADARATMLEALAEQPTRGSAIAIMNMDLEHHRDSDFSRQVNARWQALLADPELVSAARTRGNLIEPIAQTAPPEDAGRPIDIPATPL